MFPYWGRGAYVASLLLLVVVLLVGAVSAQTVTAEMAKDKVSTIDGHHHGRICIWDNRCSPLGRRFPSLGLMVASVQLLPGPLQCCLHRMHALTHRDRYAQPYYLYVCILTGLPIASSFPLKSESDSKIPSDMASKKHAYCTVLYCTVVVLGHGNYQNRAGKPALLDM
jgi:hypothetical protein